MGANPAMAATMTRRRALNSSTKHTDCHPKVQPMHTPILRSNRRYLVEVPGIRHKEAPQRASPEVATPKRVSSMGHQLAGMAKRLNASASYARDGTWSPDVNTRNTSIKVQAHHRMPLPPTIAAQGGTQIPSPAWMPRRVMEECRPSKSTAHGQSTGRHLPRGTGSGLLECIVCQALMPLLFPRACPSTDGPRFRAQVFRETPAAAASHSSSASGLTRRRVRAVFLEVMVRCIRSCRRLCRSLPSSQCTALRTSQTTKGAAAVGC